MPAMGNMDVFNALVEFESQISCCKRVAGVSGLCFVNKAQVICSVLVSSSILCCCLLFI